MTDRFEPEQVTFLFAFLIEISPIMIRDIALAGALRTSEPCQTVAPTRLVIDYEYFHARTWDMFACKNISTSTVSSWRSDRCLRPSDCRVRRDDECTHCTDTQNIPSNRKTSKAPRAMRPVSRIGTAVRHTQEPQKAFYKVPRSSFTYRLTKQIFATRSGCAPMPFPGACRLEGLHYRHAKLSAASMLL